MINGRSTDVNFTSRVQGQTHVMGSHWLKTLMYHAIARVADDPHRICVSPQRFEVQMRYLKRRGLRGVSMRELLRAAGTKYASRLVGLTFDDGYENFLHTAVPILNSFGFSATVFVCGGMLGMENTWDERPRMKLLGAEGIREAAKRGMEIGSHGMSHIKLSGLQATRLEEEVVKSRRVLSEVLDEAVEGFCYPYGSVDRAVTQVVHQGGYAYACACWTQVEGGIYDLPRPPVWEIDNPLILSLKLKFFPLFMEINERRRNRRISTS